MRTAADDHFVLATGERVRRAGSKGNTHRSAQEPISLFLTRELQALVDPDTPKQHMAKARPKPNPAVHTRGQKRREKESARRRKGRAGSERQTPADFLELKDSTLLALLQGCCSRHTSKPTWSAIANSIRRVEWWWYGAFFPPYAQGCGPS